MIHTIDTSIDTVYGYSDIKQTVYWKSAYQYI